MLYQVGLPPVDSESTVDSEFAEFACLPGSGVAIADLALAATAAPRGRLPGGAIAASAAAARS